MRITKTTFKNTSILGTLFLFMFATIYFARMVSAPPGGQDVRSHASAEAGQVQLFLYPKDVIAEVGQTFTIAPKAIGPDEKKISSISLSFRFDPQLLRLKQVKEEDKSGMTLLKFTELSSLETEGKFDIFLGADDENNAPSGAVNLPRLEFEVLKSGRGSVTIESTSGELIFISGEKADLVIQSISTIVASQEISTPTTHLPADLSVETSVKAEASAKEGNPSPTTTLTLTPTLILPSSSPTETIQPTITAAIPEGQ